MVLSIEDTKTHDPKKISYTNLIGTNLIEYDRHETPAKAGRRIVQIGKTAARIEPLGNSTKRWMDTKLLIFHFFHIFPFELEL